MEHLTGRRFNWDGFQERAENAKQADVLYRDILVMRQNIPSPITIFDILMDYLFPTMVLRGRCETVEFYEMSEKEIAAKGARKEGAVPSERFGLHWNGVPICFAIGHTSRKFASHGAAALTGP